MSNTNSNLVSVIITTRNEIKNIENCLVSIINQVYKNIEIILVDNNSNDATKETARKYTSLVFNKGPERSAQRNFGAKKAKGDYLLFIDADMILLKNVVKECVGKMRGDVKAIVIPEKSIGIGYWAQCKALERTFYEGDSSIEAARFFDKKKFWEIGGYDERITGPEDWDLPQRLGLKYKIGRINSFICHNEGKMSLAVLLKKKHYYGLKVSKYLKNNHPLRMTAQQVIYLLRPAFYKKWRLILRNPLLAAGMIFMLFTEQLAGFTGFVRGNFNNEKN